MKMKNKINNKNFLSGREASILCLLALMTHTGQTENEDKVLESLDGRALKIGRAILGAKTKDKSILLAAGGFITWVESFPAKDDKYKIRVS